MTMEPRRDAMIRKSGRRRAWSLGAGLVVVSLAATAWALSRQETTLIDLARPVCPVLPPRTTNSFGSVFPQNQKWISSHELLIVTPREASIFDTKTGRLTRLQELTDRLNRPSQMRTAYRNRLDLSPDGQWLHWEDVRPVYKQRWLHHAARLDGSLYREWVSDNGCAPVWMDDRHYAEGDWRGDALRSLHVFDAFDPRSDRDIKPTSGISLLREYAFFGPNYSLLAGPGSAPVPGARTPAPGGDFGVTLMDPLTYVSRIPDHPELMTCFASPQHTAFVYFVRTVRVSPLLLLLHRLLPSVSVKRTFVDEIWVSNRDGSALRELGHVPGGAGGTTLGQVQWLPDGKQIAFTYRGSWFVIHSE